MTKIELVAGQTWLPAARIGVALPRQIKPFTDATGARWVSWRYLGFSNIGGSMPVKSFRGWIRRTGATIAAPVDPGAAEAAAFRRGAEAMKSQVKAYCVALVLAGQRGEFGPEVDALPLPEDKR